MLLSRLSIAFLARTVHHFSLLIPLAYKSQAARYPFRILLGEVNSFGVQLSRLEF